jgi:hypothetical protein
VVVDNCGEWETVMCGPAGPAILAQQAGIDQLAQGVLNAAAAKPCFGGDRRHADAGVRLFAVDVIGGDPQH